MSEDAPLLIRGMQLAEIKKSWKHVFWILTHIFDGGKTSKRGKEQTALFAEVLNIAPGSFWAMSHRAALNLCFNFLFSQNG